MIKTVVVDRETTTFHSDSPKDHIWDHLVLDTCLYQQTQAALRCVLDYTPMPKSLSEVENEQRQTTRRSSDTLYKAHDGKPVQQVPPVLNKRKRSVSDEAGSEVGTRSRSITSLPPVSSVLSQPIRSISKKERGFEATNIKDESNITRSQEA